MTPQFTMLLALGASSALFSLALHRKHLLMSLLMLEAFMLIIVALYPLLLINQTNQHTPLALILLTMAACEASLGLALLVMTARINGNDLLHAMTKSLC